MSSPMKSPAQPNLPPATRQVLDSFLAAARQTLGENLRSAVLFGSAAEGRLRAHSDVNLVLVLRRFDSAQASALQAEMALAAASISLRTMLLEEGELEAAIELFAQKFADILRRRVVIHGDDPFAGRGVPRAAVALRTRQELMNLALRMRERFILDAARPDQLARIAEDATGPLRGCAAAILDLEGQAIASPKEAFAQLIGKLGAAEWAYLPEYLAGLRQGRVAAQPEPAQVVNDLMSLAAVMRRRVETYESL